MARATLESFPHPFHGPMVVADSGAQGTQVPSTADRHLIAVRGCLRVQEWTAAGRERLCVLSMKQAVQEAGVHGCLLHNPFSPQSKEHGSVHGCPCCHVAGHCLGEESSWSPSHAHRSLLPLPHTHLLFQVETCGTKRERAGCATMGPCAQSLDCLLAVTRVAQCCLPGGKSP